jgi:hypothetical protein
MPALPIFVFWTLIVVLIWLFLLGVSRIANGHYTIAEIISTFVMAASCVFGAVRAVQIGTAVPDRLAYRDVYRLRRLAITGDVDQFHSVDRESIGPCG